MQKRRRRDRREHQVREAARLVEWSRKLVAGGLSPTPLDSSLEKAVVLLDAEVPRAQGGVERVCLEGSPLRVWLRGQRDRLAPLAPRGAHMKAIK